MVVVVTRARSASEVAKWMTTRCELRPESTTSLPRMAWIAMTPTAPSAGQNSEATERYFTQAKTATAITRTMTMDAEARCEYSMMAWKVSGGYHLPWQRGQSGQPSPDPVPRTVPPAPISTSVITVVASDSFWNRFTRRGPPEGTNGSWAGGHYSAGAASVDRQGALHGVRVDVALEVVLARRQPRDVVGHRGTGLGDRRLCVRLLVGGWAADDVEVVGHRVAVLEDHLGGRVGRDVELALGERGVGSAEDDRPLRDRAARRRGAGGRHRHLAGHLGGMDVAEIGRASCREGGGG